MRFYGSFGVVIGCYAPYVSLWVLIGPYVSLWVLVCPYCSLYVFMGPIKSLCVLKCLKGFLLVFMRPHGF